MATRIKASFFSQDGVRYDVFLDEGVPDAGGLDISLTAADLEYRPNSEDIDANILAGRFSVTYLIRTSEQLAILKDMAVSRELEYRLRIHRNSSLYWVGFVLPERARRDFDGFPFSYRVSATDGVSRLKSIDYVQPDGSAELVTIGQHLRNILSEIPLQDYFSANDPYLSIHTTLVPEGITPANTWALLDNTRISFKALRTVNERGEIQYINCHQALLEILKVLGQKFAFIDGRYRLIEIFNNADQNIQVHFNNYDINGLLLTGETLTGWSERTIPIVEERSAGETVALDGSTITYLPPLRGIELFYKHFTRQNLLPDFSNVTIGFATQQFFVPNFGTDGGNGTLSVGAEITTGPATADGSADLGSINPTLPFFVVFGFRVAIVDPDDNTQGISLRRTVEITDTGFTYGPAEWVLDSVDEFYRVVVRKPPLATESPGPQTDFVSFITPPVPDSGTLVFTIRQLETYIESSLNPLITVNSRADNVFLESLLTGSIEDQFNYTKFKETTTSDGVNSILLEREHIFGDGPGENTFGRIEYLNGSNWELTDGWQRWAGGIFRSPRYMPIGALVAYHTLALQDEQRELLDITIISPDYNPGMLLDCDNTIYFAQAVRLNLLNDEWRGSWVETGLGPIQDGGDGTPSNGEATTTGPAQTDSGGGISGNDPQWPPRPPSPPTPGGAGGGGIILDNSGLQGVGTIETPLPGPGGTVSEIEVGDDFPFGGLTAGDGLVIQNPISGATQVVEVAFDGGLAPGNSTDPGAIQVEGLDGNLVWVVPTTDTIAITEVTLTNSFPQGSVITTDPASDLAIRGEMRSAVQGASNRETRIVMSNLSLTDVSNSIFNFPSLEVGKVYCITMWILWTGGNLDIQSTTHGTSEGLWGDVSDPMPEQLGTVNTLTITKVGGNATIQHVKVEGAMLTTGNGALLGVNADVPAGVTITVLKGSRITLEKH